MKGKLIVIEGSDASGKKTQSELLVKRLKKEGYKTAYFDFPAYNSKTGKKVTNYLRGDYGSIKDVSPYFASLLYADDRLALRDKITERLKEGRIVVINRYVLSNKAHQSVKIDSKEEKESFFKWVDDIEYKKNMLPKEDILVYLYVPIRIIAELIKKNKEKSHLKGKGDIHESNIGYLRKVEKQYLDLVKRDKTYIKLGCVENNKLLSIRDINERLWIIIDKKLKE